MGRKHRWRPAKRSKNSAASAETLKKPRPLLALTAPPAENVSESTALLPFDSSGLAARTAAALPKPLARLVDLLTCGVFEMLDSVSCARAASVTRVLHSLLEVMAADRVQAVLQNSCLLCDAVDPRKKPLLALSHLESFVASPFLFSATRDVMKLFYDTDPDGEEHVGILLEVSGDEEKLSDSILRLAFPEIVDDTELKESVSALLMALLFHFKPAGDRWSIMLLKSLMKRCKTSPSLKNLSVGSSLEMFLLGVAEVLPVTKTALKASKSLDCRITQATLLCQFLERLLSKSSLVLHVSCPVDASALVPVNTARGQNITDIEAGEQATEARVSGAEHGVCKPTAARAAAATAAAMAQADQSKEFLHTLRTLEAEALSPESKAFELWALQAADRYYLLFLE